MTYLISCEFNMDTACVELKFNDGSMIAIDTIAVENEVADNMYQRSELDWLIYNAPLEYADLILNGDPEKLTWKQPVGRQNPTGCVFSHILTVLSSVIHNLTCFLLANQHSRSIKSVSEYIACAANCEGTCCGREECGGNAFYIPK